MPEWIKNILWGGLGVGYYLLLIGVFVFGVIGLVWFTEYFIDWLGVLNQLTLAAFALLLLASLIPRARDITGNGIYLTSYVFALLLWLLCLLVTYETWGVVGVFIGAVLLGVGIYATAVVALLLNGDFSSAATILVSLAAIYGIRFLGHWITSKYRPRPQVEDELTNRILSGKADMADWMEADGHITHEANLEIKAKEEKRGKE